MQKLLRDRLISELFIDYRACWEKLSEKTSLTPQQCQKTDQ